MPSFRIADGINAAIDVTPRENSAFIRYFRSLSNFSVNGALLALRSGVTLADPAIRTLTTGIDFSGPMDVGAGQVDLKIGGGVNGSLGIFKPEGTDASLFEPDPYEDPIPVAPADRYVSFQVTAAVSTSLAAGPGDLQFGFSAGSSVSIANFRRFTTTPAAPELVEAVKATVAEFVLPGDIEDLRDMPVDTIVTLAGSGTLKLSGTVELLAAVNPLASATLPAPLPSVALKAGGSINVGASIEITGEYQIRIIKSDPDRIRLAFYRKAGAAFDIKATASAGLAAGIGTTDILARLIAAVSSDAKADTDELARAGLAPGEIQAIADAVTGSVQRSIEIAVAAELGGGRERTAAFVYDIDLSALEQASRAALHAALDGDLSGLTRAAGLPLSGIRVVRDLFANVRERRHSLGINLLGILNYGRISKLVLEGKTMYEPLTGNLVISDAATASRIGTTVVNVGVADAEKLRKVMAENFLITVAYRGARASGLAPDLATTHSFFALNQHTTPETVRDELEVCVALGLASDEDADRVSRSAPGFGRTLFFAKADYDHALSMRLFLDNGRPRPVEFYERAGLQALSALVRHGDADEARLAPVENEALWRSMKAQGQPGIKRLFPGISDPVVGAVISDYSLISWWSETMHATAVKLAEMNRFLDGHPAADDQNNDFKRLRNSLADHLRAVAANTRENFGRPWGLLAMFNASGRQALCKTVLIGTALSLSAET